MRAGSLRRSPGRLPSPLSRPHPPVRGRRELSSTAAGRAAAARRGWGGRTGMAPGRLQLLRGHRRSPRSAAIVPFPRSPFAWLQSSGRRAQRPARPPSSRQQRERGLRVGSGPRPAPPVLPAAGSVRGDGSTTLARGSGAGRRLRAAACGAERDRRRAGRGEAGGGGKGSKQHVIPAEQRGSRGRGERGRAAEAEEGSRRRHRFKGSRRGAAEHPRSPGQARRSAEPGSGAEGTGCAGPGASAAASRPGALAAMRGGRPRGRTARRCPPRLPATPR